MMSQKNAVRDIEAHANSMSVDAAEKSKLTKSSIVKFGISKSHQELDKDKECASSAETAAKRPSLRYHQDPSSITLGSAKLEDVCPAAQSEDSHTSSLTSTKTDRTSRRSMNVDFTEKSKLTESTILKSGTSKLHQELDKNKECTSSAETSARSPILRHNRDHCSRTDQLNLNLYVPQYRVKIHLVFHICQH